MAATKKVKKVVNKSLKSEADQTKSQHSYVNAEGEGHEGYTSPASGTNHDSPIVNCSCSSPDCRTIITQNWSRSRFLEASKP
ncbi:hypothetical protein LINPERPRIM_LOCUS15443 [Linum perenne]